MPSANVVWVLPIVTVIDIFFILLQVIYLCIKFESNRTIIYGDIAY